MQTLYRLKALGRSYRIKSCSSFSDRRVYYYVESYINHDWRLLNKVYFYSYDDVLEYLISHISNVIRCTAKLSPLS